VVVGGKDYVQGLCAKEMLHNECDHVKSQNLTKCTE